MVAAQGGDGTAYGRLLRDIAPFVRILLRRSGIGAGPAEDVVQDVLLTVHRVRETYDPTRPFIPWLTAITRRRMIDAVRRSSRIDAFEEAAPDALEEVANSRANAGHESRENREWLHAAMQGLPPKQRMALELVKLRELPVVEAAALSGQTPGAVKVNVHRAVRALRTMLGGR